MGRRVPNVHAQNSVYQSLAEPACWGIQGGAQEAEEQEEEGQIAPSGSYGFRKGELAMRYYVALIHKEKDSTFGVSFPDFPGCVTGGETIEEAIERAADILAAHVAGMREDGDPIPEPRSVEHIRKARDEWVDFTD